jgi:hypothetical protein
MALLGPVLVALVGLDGGPFAVVVAVLLCAVVLLGMAAYCYFMFKNPEMLRTEEYSLDRLKIEKGYMGDSDHGIVVVERPVVSPSTVVPLPLPATDEEELEQTPEVGKEENGK